MWTIPPSFGFHKYDNPGHPPSSPAICWTKALSRALTGSSLHKPWPGRGLHSIVNYELHHRQTSPQLEPDSTLNQLAVSYLQLASKHLSLNISLHGTYLLLQKCVFLLTFLFLSMRSFSAPHLRSIVFPAQIRTGTRLAMQRDRGEQLHTSRQKIFFSSRQNYSNS